MKKICFVTGTRADYGIMAPIMKKIKESGESVLQIIATNMHLSSDFGMTVNDIEKDGFIVDAKIESLVPGDTPSSVVKSMANVQTGLSEAFRELNPDMVVILGDRYEALAAASSAVVFRIPIAHLHGGEITEGAIDDRFRHAITKLASYHFASTPQYMDRIISMGESAEKVFHSGAPGSELKESDNISYVDEFYRKTGLKVGEKFFLMAFHPVTLSYDGGMSDLNALIQALNTYILKGFKILVTMPNSDPGNRKISICLRDWEKANHGKVICVKSLGACLFRYAMRVADLMIGNSSAALIEAPSFKLPSINIGDRQKGRASGPSVINVSGNAEKINAALELSVSDEFKTALDRMSLSEINPYFKPNASSFIAEKISELVTGPLKFESNI